VISGEDWFAIANQMLAHDAYKQESRPSGAAPRFGRAYRPRAERVQRQGPPMSFAH
jgi:hypothetical protein